MPVSVWRTIAPPTIYIWLPHHVPQYEGGLSFRFAMAHDVIHERFARHGRDHYLERNRLAQAAIDALPADDPKRWPLADDLAAGLDRVGESAAAVKVMQEKLSSQIQANVTGRDLYTTYANLGTFLIHANFRGALAGDAAAVEQFSEGVEFIRKSVEVNPEAHFGRERWQSAIAEFILTTVESPDLLQQFDCVGNRLDRSYQDCVNGIMSDELFEREYGAAVGGKFSGDMYRFRETLPEYFDQDFVPEDPANWQKVNELRELITIVGAEDGWEQVDVPSHREGTPFDEPMLGIIGMWRQGGGANPHFSLAIAETMLRVGQRNIAWTAYARTLQMVERYSIDPATREFLVGHCKQRQTDIENDLGSEHAGLQAQFEDELAFGVEYQKSYQDFQTRQLSEGVPLGAPDFFAGFEGEQSIASPSGTEETRPYRHFTTAMEKNIFITNALLFAGIFSLLTLLPGWLMSAFAMFRNRREI